MIEEAHRETIIAQAVGDFFAYGNDPETWASFVQKYAEQLGEPAESIDADIRGRIVNRGKKLQANGEEKQADTTPFPLVHVSKFRGEDIAISWTIEGIYERGGRATIFGASESYKTFLALSQAACIATGVDWYGRAVQQCATAYILGEGRSGIMQRIMAWETHHGISLDDHPFYLSTIPAQFTLEESAMAVYEALKGLDVGAVFVDTLSRNFGPGNENSTQDMAFYVTFGDRYIRQPFEALYVDVHHSGLMDDSRGRGSSVLRGALDAEFKMARFGDSVTLECTKMKNAERPPGMEFAVHPVELSTQDKGGEPISSVVLEYEGEPDTENKGIVKGMGPNQLNARAILIELYADQKKHLEGTGREPSVLHDDWKRACRKEGLNRNQFRDVEKGLDKRKIIFRKPPYVYLAGEEGESV